MKKVYKVYDKIAEQFSDTRRYAWPEFESIYGVLKAGDKVLDVGCGNGRFYKFLPDDLEIDYLGIDPSVGMLRQAEVNCDGGQFKKGGYEDLKMFEDGAFDVVVGVASFHHLEGKKLMREAVLEMKRILKPGGKLVLTVWNLWQRRYARLFWDSFWRGEFRHLMVPWKKMKVDRYYYAFKESEFKALFAEDFELLEFKKGHNFMIVCEKK